MGRIFRSDYISLVVGLVVGISAYLLMQEGMTKEGLIATILATVSIITIKYGLAILLHRLTFYYARPHLFLQKTDGGIVHRRDFWFSCLLRFGIIAVFLLAVV